MKHINKIVIIALLAAVACQSPKEKAFNKIKTLEGNDSAFSNELMSELKLAYLDFATAYPDDEHAAEFTFKAAQRAIVLQQPTEAVELLAKILVQYPKSPFCEEALFLEAYTNENNLNDLPKAKANYEEFLKKYPKGELAQDASLALENLGKTPEEILKGEGN